MRRWLGLVAACGCLALTLTGCYHTAGVCDCDLGDDHGGYDHYGVLGHYPFMSAQPEPAVYLAPAPTAASSDMTSKAQE
jgi:hypothetical protein